MTTENTAKKFFVSYKYKDSDVYSVPVSEFKPGEDTNYLYTPRHYVDKIIKTVGEEHIYKGELGDEGMDDLSDDIIHSKLKQKIFDSSITIALISPRMWDKTRLEKEQWIPKEVAYSLRNKTMGERNSKTNGMLAVALPDKNGSYNHAVVQKACGVTQWQTSTYFRILNKNMFNKNNKNQSPYCATCYGYHHQGDDHSYIYQVKWDDFINNHSTYIDHALALRDRMDDFELTKTHD